MIDISFVLPSFAGGGAERVTLMIAAGLDRLAFRPSLIVLTDHGPLARQVPSDVPVTTLDRPRLRKALPRLRRTLKSAQPDLVFSTMAYLNFGVLLLKPSLQNDTAVIIREANEPFAGTSGPVRWLQHILYRRLYRNADAIVSPSLRIAGRVAAAAKIAEAEIEVVFNPVDEAKIRQAAAAAAHKREGGRLFVAAGRLTRQKGFDRLIDMMAAMPPDDRLVILGEGPDRDTLAALIDGRALTGRVTLPGFSDNPWAVMAAADAFVLPSRWEGLPNAALEALACGTPVVATPEAGGIGEIAALARDHVTIAQAGAPFVRAMMNTARRDPDGIPPSLLPSAFSLDAAVSRYEALFRTIALRRN